MEYASQRCPSLCQEALLDSWKAVNCLLLRKSFWNPRYHLLVDQLITPEPGMICCLSIYHSSYVSAPS